MDNTAIAAVILAAGQGVRMKSDLPKVLHPVGAKPMLAHVIDAAAALDPRRLAIVVGDQAPQVREAATALRPDAQIAVQAPPRGTGDAVAKATPALEGFDGVVLILYADTPLIEPQTLRGLVKAAHGRAGAVLGFRAADPGGYGRLVLDKAGGLERIVEAKDASPQELAIDLCNSGVMAVEAAFLRSALPRLAPNNAKNEYYLTDIIAMARGEGQGFAVAFGDEDEVLGVNSRIELSAAEQIFQERRRILAMADGATLIDPSTVYFSHDTQIGRDVVVEPNVWFGPGVSIADGARIRAFSHLEGARVGPGAQVGPFARLRPGAELQTGARVGNFVEVKAATIGEGAKVNHLAYIGDAGVGARANIGAGAITCNYDGFGKHRTEIGADAFIGSNAALVAPVSIGKGAYVGSGSVVTRNVEDDALAVARGRQKDIPGWAARFRKAHEGKRQE
ncbi:MAG: bifunctional UDP-N-acetylglucosamine diphosphorylase/glucosamine-1-phosphate N-acetyltransferase GlmU [Alphaproteobacteria bacterium]|nr:bifunctional UDP-N-acetylglucosamine diphosphorylase/glucosamine-1-phosphate N-acetyltransferase GlmU [Alphaproteobacteria bacterium]